MQTFLTSYNLADNASKLDNRRLFCQLKEGYQILNTLYSGKGWINHPAVKQWKGYETALYLYIKSIWEECKRRNIAPESQLFFKSKGLVKSNIGMNPDQITVDFPPWWGREDIVASHRGRLLCKGLIDSYCFAIKKSNKIKNLDGWLKARLKKTKNSLRFKDIETLKGFVVDGHPVPDNFYAQFDWKESPDMDYVWPGK